MAICAELFKAPGRVQKRSIPRSVAGQIAAREMEVVRIKGALQRAEELSDDVAAAMEGAF
jgi:hypothetical protein